jgi:hypothetical protein
MRSYVTSFKVNHGRNILPIKRMEVFSAEEWEIFIEEWLEIKKSQYVEVERFGGAGDKGRDVAAYISDPKVAGYDWDCFQCKHYDRPLMPAQMWIEFGKIIYYTFIKEYPVPKKYFFVAPKGCGTSFTKLLQNESDIKAGLLAHWDKDVSEHITSGVKIGLTPELTAYINVFDYGIFDRVQPKTIIEEHKSHPNHLTWFGGGLPDREMLDETTIAAEIGTQESQYVNQLVKAYSSDSPTEFSSITEVAMESNHYRHFTRARISFHHAEQLRNFSRDNLPNGTFESFQTEVLDGIINLAESAHVNSFEKVKAVENQSAIVPITSNALREVINTKDKTGVCHQLCNDKKINWVENESK